jgi:hypothetical protein
MFRVACLAVVIVLTAGAGFAQPTPAMRKACEADYHRSCATVLPGGGRILKCLADHESDLTPECRSSLQQRRGDTK